MEEEEGIAAWIKVKDEEVGVANEDVSTAKGKGVASNYKRQTACREKLSFFLQKYAPFFSQKYAPYQNRDPQSS